jgi:hypothetical protein
LRGLHLFERRRVAGATPNVFLNAPENATSNIDQQRGRRVRKALVGADDEIKKRPSGIIATDFVAGGEQLSQRLPIGNRHRKRRIVFEFGT